MASILYDDGSLQQRNYALGAMLRGIENLIYFVVLLFFSGIVIGVLFTDLGNLDQENPFARLVWFPVYGVIILLGLRCLPQFVRIAAFNPILVICVLWCGLSMFWSLDQAITMRRAVALLVTTVFGLVLAARYDWNGLVQRLALVFAFLAVFTVLYTFIDPARAIMSEIHVGAWRGGWVEKNYLGGQMTRGLMIMMCAFAMRPDRGWLWVPMGLLCFFLVVMSTSKTALLASVAAIGLFIILRLFRRFPVLRIPVAYMLIAGVGLFAVLALAIPEVLLQFIGKDITLTGRTDIWGALTDSIKQKPWMGFGYGIYWLDPLGPSYYVRLQLQWGIPSAHNGWIETWLAVGFIGVLLFAVQFVWTSILALNRIRRGGSETYFAVLAIVVFLIFSLSESSILQQNDLSWVIFVAVSAKLFAFEKPYWRHKPRENYFTQYVPRAIND